MIVPRHMGLSDQVFRFVVIGGLTFCLYVTVLVGSIERLGAPPGIGAGLAYAIALVFNYAGHYFITFKSDSRHAVAGTRFLVLSAVIFAVNVAFTTYGPSILHVGYVVVQAAFLIAVVAFSYFAYSGWVFASRLGGRDAGVAD